MFMDINIKGLDKKYSKFVELAKDGFKMKMHYGTWIYYDPL